MAAPIRSGRPRFENPAAADLCNPGLSFPLSRWIWSFGSEIGKGVSLISIGRAGGETEGDASSRWSGTMIPQPQAGHFDRRPACSTFAANFRPHAPHENLIIVDRPYQSRPRDIHKIAHGSVGQDRCKREGGQSINGVVPEGDMPAIGTLEPPLAPR
jgi:hypothetical protein